MWAFLNINLLFIGGDNWYPAIIGSKAVCLLLFQLPTSSLSTCFLKEFGF